MATEDPITLTFDDAERLYGDIMRSVWEIISALGSDVDDDRVSDIYHSLDITVRDIYAYAAPPKR